MPSSPAVRTAVDVVNDYLHAFYAGDHDWARGVVDDEFSFTGPFVSVFGKEPFFASAAGLKALVHGHRLVRQWSDGDDICSIYDVDLASPAGAGTVTMSEWHRVRDGVLQSGRVLFDSAAFRALLPAG
jgi:hypothetical protein